MSCFDYISVKFILTGYPKEYAKHLFLKSIDSCTEKVTLSSISFVAFVVISFDVPGCNSAPIFPDTGLSFVQEYISKEKELSLESPLLC